ncbi:hypothetical protein P8452_21110 [Trifolium repens]|nr:hypothetical protein P8452_21110 [Trifolium repens]
MRLVAGRVGGDEGGEAKGGDKKATGAVAKTSQLSSSGMEIEIAELLYGLMTSKKVSKRRLRTRYINSGNISSSVVNFVANSFVSSSVSEEEKEQEVAMSLIMLIRDVRPWCGLVEEDETEQLKASVDYLVELCETISPVDDSKFANLAHQSVEFILVGVFLCPRLDCRGPVVVAYSLSNCLVVVCVAWQ